MRDKNKKILSIVAAATMLSTVFAFGGCGDYYKEADKLDGINAETKAYSNGGFAVEKDDYVYFINGTENYTASNKHGDVVKGALMRIKKTDLAAGNSENVQTVVSSLFVAQNFNAGIFIYGDKVYYATPTTDKSVEDGTVQNTWIDFKSAKLDGTATMKGYYFRLSNNAANYRFVEENGTVYCLYEETNDAGVNQLKSYNTETDTTTTLVSGAEGSFYYDMNDLTNPVVYYTMPVSVDIDSDTPSKMSYNQIYSVSASATVTDRDEKKASYTTSSGYTYDFDEKYLEEQNKEAKENDQKEPYDLKDYTTYPYVNLGTLVLDGIGSLKGSNPATQFNHDYSETVVPESLNGYKYTIAKYASYNDGAVSGLYFTRADAESTYGTDTSLYFLGDTKADGWNTISGNNKDNFVKVAPNTKNTANAIFYVNGENQNYVYVDSTSNKLMKMENGVEIAMKTGMSGVTLLQLNGDYLYYTTGTNVSRINYKGAASDYEPEFLAEEAYQSQTIPYVTWNSTWYKPEIIADTLLFSNGTTINGATYNYIYTTSLDADLSSRIESYEDEMEKLEELSKEDNQLLEALKYNFTTGETSAFQAVEEDYDKVLEGEKTQKDFFYEYANNNEAVRLNKFITLISEVNAADKEAIENGWIASLDIETETEEAEEEKFPGWAIALIVIASVIVVGTAVAIPTILYVKKKKASEKADEITNAYKNKIDTTDDKSIDVYADDEATEEATTEETEVVAEETVEETTEEVVSETEEVEEAPVEAEETAETAEEPVAETTEEATTEEAVEATEEVAVEEPKTEE